MTWNSVIYRVIIVVTLPCTAYDYIIAVCKAASLLTVTGDRVRPPETALRKKVGGGGRLSSVTVLAFRGATLPRPSLLPCRQKGCQRSLLFATPPAQSRDFQRSARADPDRWMHY